MTNGQPVARDKSARDLLGAAVGMYRHNFGLLLGVSALVQAPLMALSVVASGLRGGGGPGHTLWGAGGLAGSLTFLYMAAAWIAGSLCAGATTLAASDLCLRRKPTVRDCYRRAQVWWGALIGAGLCTGILVVLAVFAAMVVLGALCAGLDQVYTALWHVEMSSGSYVVAVYMLPAVVASLVVSPLLLAVFPAVVLENRDAWGAIDRSVDLVRRYWGQAFAVLAAPLLLLALPHLVLQAMAAARGGLVHGHIPFNLTQQALAALVVLLVSPAVTAASVVVYYELRRREEGRRRVKTLQ